MPKLRRHIIPISGKDSLCTALVQRARDDSHAYEYVFCDTKMELPETYAWLETVEKTLDIKITKIGESVEGLIEWHNMLPSHQRRFCTKEAKILPIKKWLGHDDAVQYLGIRADEVDRLESLEASAKGITHSYPLVELGIKLPNVYTILGNQGLMPPDFFWQRLYDEVMEQSNRFTRQYVIELKPWVKADLFSWRSRSNCFMCFYQRLYEWVGLLFHHPDLFERAEQLEFDYGSVDSGNRLGLQHDFNWKQDWPLRRIRAYAEELFRRRVNEVQKECVARRQGRRELTQLDVVSCGLYCGK